jgi:DNA-binding GntR family transcriptional regulator
MNLMNGMNTKRSSAHRAKVLLRSRPSASSNGARGRRPKVKQAMTPRKPKYLAEGAYDELRLGIMNARYRPGDRLKEEQLVRELRVSRSVVRQALMQLTAEGLLLDEPKRGKSVAQFTEEKLAKLLPIRISLEQLAVLGAIAV